jgi:hypothetical protein
MDCDILLKSFWTKNIRLTSILVFTVFVSSTFFVRPAFGAVTEGCGFFDFSLECDLSGWMKLLIGDLGIAAVLALLLHTLAHRTQGKIKALVKSETVLRERRKDYTVTTLKTLFNTVFFTIGIIHKTMIGFNKEYLEETNKEQKTLLRGIMLAEIRAEEAKMNRMLQAIRTTLATSSDVLDPDITEQINGVISFIGEISTEEIKDGTLNYPKFGVCKAKIKYLMEKLSTYDLGTHSFVIRERKTTENMMRKVKPSSVSNRKNLLEGRIAR